MSFENAAALHIQRVVFDKVATEKAVSAGDQYYVVPNCRGVVHVSVGPDVDLYGVTVCDHLLVDLEQDAAGFIYPL